jgi:hypothetical protein
MATYTEIEFNTYRWTEEPETQEDEEKRLQDLFSAYVQRYQGDRDLDWLQNQAFEEIFGMLEWEEEEHILLHLFLEFTRCIFLADHEDEDNSESLQRIYRFLTDYEHIYNQYAENSIIKTIFSDIWGQLRQRRDNLQNI